MKKLVISTFLTMFVYFSSCAMSTIKKVSLVSSQGLALWAANAVLKQIEAHARERGAENAIRQLVIPEDLKAVLAKCWSLTYSKYDSFYGFTCINEELGYGFSIAELAAIGRLPKIIKFEHPPLLNSLSLDRKRINSLAGLKDIPDVACITNLDFEYNEITDVPSKELEGLKQLQLLSFKNNHIETLPIELLKNLPCLMALDVRNNPLGGTTLAALCELKKYRPNLWVSTGIASPSCGQDIVVPWSWVC